jgi:two-component system LytT family response regulator
MLRALIIDDEPLARDALRILLSAHPAVTIVGEAGALADARTLLARDNYDLVLLDIQLRGGSGFDLVPLVRAGAHLVFVTAHDEHAVRAFEINALDYLLKPVRPERLAASLARIAQSPAPGPATSLRADDTVFLKIDSGARFVPLAEIAAILSCENYSEVLLAGGEKLLVRRTLKAWEDLLPRPPFIRAHRTALVNLARLARIEEDGGDAPLLHFAGVTRTVRASRREWAEAIAAFPPATIATLGRK